MVIITLIVIIVILILAYRFSRYEGFTDLYSFCLHNQAMEMADRRNLLGRAQIFYDNNTVLQNYKE